LTVITQIIIIFKLLLLEKKICAKFLRTFLSQPFRKIKSVFSSLLSYLFFLLVVFMAKFVKRAADIHLPSRKREASKMDVSPLTQCMISSLLLCPKHHLQVMLNREALKELSYTFSKTRKFLTYDPLFLFVLLHLLFQCCQNSQKRSSDTFSIQKVYVM